MKLQSLWTFQSVPNIFSDCPHLVKKSTRFRIVLNEFTKPVDHTEWPKHLSDFPQLVKNSTIFRIVSNEVTTPVDLPECPKHFSDYQKLVKNSTSFRIVSNEVTKPVDLPECPKHFFWLPTTCKKNLQASQLLWMNLQSLWTKQSVLNIFSDCP